MGLRLEANGLGVNLDLDLAVAWLVIGLRSLKAVMVRPKPFWTLSTNRMSHLTEEVMVPPSVTWRSE